MLLQRKCNLPDTVESRSTPSSRSSLSEKTKHSWGMMTFSSLSMSVRATLMCGAGALLPLSAAAPDGFGRAYRRGLFVA